MFIFGFSFSVGVIVVLGMMCLEILGESCATEEQVFVFRTFWGQGPWGVGMGEHQTPL